MRWMREWVVIPSMQLVVVVNKDEEGKEEYLTQARGLEDRDDPAADTYHGSAALWSLSLRDDDS